MMTKLAGFITFAAAMIYCEAFAQPRDVAFQAKADGTEQFYMEILPANFDQNKIYDVIIGLHDRGADRSQFATDGRPECAAFRAVAAQYGMIAITPDFRAKASWMGPKAEADVVQIIHDLKNKYKINRVFVVGVSMGGTASVTFSAIHPDMVDGATSMNGHANHLEFAGFQDEIAASFGGSKNAIPMEYKKRSAEYWPKVLTMPIAFTVGGKDTVVPPESTIRLAENLKKMNRKVLLLQRPDGGHSTDFEDATAALEFMYGPEELSAASENPVPPASPVVSTPAAPVGNWSGIKPALEAQGKVELGLKFSVEKTGKITAFRFYQAKGESGAHDLRLWGTDGSLLLTVNAPGQPDAGWISVPLPQPFAASAGNVFVVSYTSNTKYPATPDFFDAPKRLGNITAITGVYSLDALGEKAPDKILRNMNYFLDVELE
jgi:pimeloyl-ACP methyl ester carboxylesterase